LYTTTARATRHHGRRCIRRARRLRQRRVGSRQRASPQSRRLARLILASCLCPASDALFPTQAVRAALTTPQPAAIGASRPRTPLRSSTSVAHAAGRSILSG
jgi:hypothetical protein